MNAAIGMGLVEAFSKAGVHSITYKNDFCDIASEVREELLRYPYWKVMRQDQAGGTAVIDPSRQNGITTGHLHETDRELLPNCLRFRDFLAQNLHILCPLVDAKPEDANAVEINAMAYGAGAWLSPHTDCLEYAREENRLVAWMLYLTAPEDGEWDAEKGGAVRVFKPGGAEERVRPRFNRFAMFRVRNDSFHEIEKITWEPQWQSCRLALSGWFTGRQPKPAERKTCVYLQSPAAANERKELEKLMQGSLALYGLLEKQRHYCGREDNKTVELISDVEQDYRAHQEAPEGTSFVRRISGPAGCIIVVDEKGQTLHFGTPEEYRKKMNRPPA